MPRPRRRLGVHLVGVLQRKDLLPPQALEAAGGLAQHAQAQLQLLRRRGPAWNAG